MRVPPGFYCWSAASRSNRGGCHDHPHMDVCGNPGVGARRQDDMNWDGERNDDMNVEGEGQDDMNGE
eukprot:352891-Chlamydomonas_euryale.AAC.2